MRGQRLCPAGDVVAAISASIAHRQCRSTTIDADLSDAAWAKATVIDNLRQRQPVPGAPPTERTVLRVMYDANTIYFGIYAYDSEPDLLVVRAMARDGQIFTGDNVQIMLDPGGTRRNFYAFTIGPSGGALGRVETQCGGRSSTVGHDLGHTLRF